MRGPLVDVEHDRHGVRLEIAVAAGTDHGEGVTATRGLDLHLLDRLLDRFDVVERADIDARIVAHRGGIEVGNAGAEVDRADPVLRALLDLEGNVETLLLRIVFGERGDDLDVGETVLEIEAADQVAVGLDPIGIVDVAAGEEAQQVGFVRLDDVAQAVGRVRVVADELDRLDAGLGALLDREDEIDAVVRLLDDFRRDANVVTAGAAIDFCDSQGVGLHHGAGEGAARLGLDFTGELLVLDLLVALEGNAADHRVFHHGDDDLATGPAVDPDVLEQAGLDQRLEAVVDGTLIQATAGTRLEVGADRLHLDPAISFDGNRLHGLSKRRRRHKGSPNRGKHRRAEHDQGCEQAPPESQSKLHCATRPYHSVPDPTPTPVWRFPKFKPLVDNFTDAANGRARRNFIFIPRRCPRATPGQRHKKAPIRMRPFAGCRYRSQTPSTSAPSQARFGTPSPGCARTGADHGRPPPHRT
ncbi:hypothetical protein ACVWXL_003551 [Bradyrhizobium sp. GM22.5]